MIKVLMRDAQAALPPLPPAAALFLNLDEMLDHDSGPRLLGLLLALRGRLHGALAIITAHRLSTVDRMFAPVLLAGAGRDGTELRLRFNHPIQPRADGGGGVGMPRALLTLMAQAPFYQRTPVWLGDDNTDPAALLAVQNLGGVAIRLRAPHHQLADLIAHHWLRNGGPAPKGRRRATRHKVPPALLGTPPALTHPLTA